MGLVNVGFLCHTALFELGLDGAVDGLVPQQGTALALFGLELIDETCSRLFAAHDAVKTKDNQAQGLTALKVGVETRRSARPARSPPASQRTTRPMEGSALPRRRPRAWRWMQ